MQATSVNHAVKHSGTATLYLHVPFCLSKCGYCSFNSYPSAGRDLQNYLEALLCEAASMARHPWVQGRIFSSLYVGGGTPTIYEDGELVSLVEHCLKLFKFTDTPEISVEANPNTLTAQKIRALKEVGVNRLSIGMQSFSDAILKGIGRTHSAVEGVQAVEMARAGGFKNLSLDLIYGLPGQDLQIWRETLSVAMDLRPDHFSFYELMVEEGTRIASDIDKGLLNLPDEEVVLSMQEEAEKTLEKHSYRRYEISNYAKPGHECRHNIHYWENGSYLGLGAGAVSSLSDVRFSNINNPDTYSDTVMNNGLSYKNAECLSREAHFRETVIMGLRMMKGISLKAIQDRFGISVVEYYGDVLDKLLGKNLVVIDNGSLQLTKQGLPVANQVLSELV